MIRVRPALEADLPAILAIYNHAVAHTTATYDVEPRTLDEQAIWFAEHQRDGYAVLVAEEDGPLGSEVVGWSSLGEFRSRVGYRFTAENSVYVRHDRRGRGIGSVLLEPLIAAARDRGLHAIVAGIDADSEASLRLHARWGFIEVARFREVGRKFGRWLDVVFLELVLDGPDPADAPDDTAEPLEFYVRRARPADAAEIRRVNHASVRGLASGDYTPEQIEAWIDNTVDAFAERIARPGEMFLLAEGPDGMLGFVALAGDQLTSLYVDAAFARRGVGAALLTEAEVQARRHGVQALRLRSSVTALPFYLARGYRVEARITHHMPSGVEMPCVNMAKRL